MLGLVRVRTYQCSSLPHLPVSSLSTGAELEMTHLPLLIQASLMSSHLIVSAMMTLATIDVK